MSNTRSTYSHCGKTYCDENCNANISTLPRTLSVAMAYVPFQQWCDDIYTADKALCQGTVFPVLDLPFTMGGRCR